MKLAALLVLCSVLAYSQAKLSPEVIAALIEQANSIAAPFRDTALARLKGEIFGSDRAARSSDVIVENASGVNFTLSESRCEWGGFSTGLLPMGDLNAHESTVYGQESNGFMSGVTCKVTYKSKGSSVLFFVDNPYVGSNVISSDSTSDLVVTNVLGQGNNNQVRFIVRPRQGY